MKKQEPRSGPPKTDEGCGGALAMIGAAVCFGVHADSWLVGIGVFCALSVLHDQIARGANFVGRALEAIRRERR